MKMGPQPTAQQAIELMAQDFFSVLIICITYFFFIFGTKESECEDVDDIEVEPLEEPVETTATLNEGDEFGRLPPHHRCRGKYPEFAGHHRC